MASRKSTKEKYQHIYRRQMAVESKSFVKLENGKVEEEGRKTCKKFSNYWYFAYTTKIRTSRKFFDGPELMKVFFSLPPFANVTAKNEFPKNEGNLENLSVFGDEILTMTSSVFE